MNQHGSGEHIAYNPISFSEPRRWKQPTAKTKRSRPSRLETQTSPPKGKGKGKDHLRKPKRDDATIGNEQGEPPAKRRKGEGKSKSASIGTDTMEKPKNSAGKSKDNDNDGEHKAGKSIGGLIGRKRKERKGK